MYFNEKFKEIVGTDDLSRFKNHVKKRVTENHIREERAEKEIIESDMRSILNEFRRHKIIDVNSSEVRELTSGFKSVLSGKEGVSVAEQESDDPHIFRPININLPQARDLEAVKKKLKVENDNFEPPPIIIEEVSKRINLIGAVLNRVLIDPRFMGTHDLAPLFNRYPELRADVGKFFRSRDSILQLESKFRNSANFERSKNELISEIKASLYTMFWSAPLKFCATTLKSLLTMNPATIFTSLMYSVNSLILNESKAIGNIVISASKAGYHLIKKKI